MCWFHANATQFWIRVIINLGFYPQEALKPIHWRCWERARALTAPTTQVRQRPSIMSGTHFPYHYLEASIEDQVWSGGLTQAATNAKFSPVMVRSWIWNSPFSSPGLGSVLSFWEQSKAHLYDILYLVKPWLSSQVPMRMFRSSAHFFHKSRRDTLAALMDAVDRLQVHENPDFLSRIMWSASGGPCLLCDAGPSWLASNLTILASIRDRPIFH